jgi:DDE superfamily endonuclease
VIPPKRDAAFVAAMEIILDTYAEAVDPDVPLICFDETSTTLQTHRRDPVPMTPGHPAREDPEYGRAGSANLFVAYAPHLGWRQVGIADRRTAVDWALVMRDLVDVHFPEAAHLIVVCDNLNIHRLGSLYTAFPPAEAHRIARKLELRFTPTHGSWLNMAEFEISVLKRQVLAQRLPDPAMLAAALTAWTADRNAVAAPAHWTFTVADARTHLASLYPIPAWGE